MLVLVLLLVALPSQILRTHWQHAADYPRLMMQVDMSLTMGEDRAAPLITEVVSSMFITLASKCMLILS